MQKQKYYKFFCINGNINFLEVYQPIVFFCINRSIRSINVGQLKIINKLNQNKLKIRISKFGSGGKLLLQLLKDNSYYILEFKLKYTKISECPTFLV